MPTEDSIYSNPLDWLFPITNPVIIISKHINKLVRFILHFLSLENYPFIPDIVIPSVKYFLKRKKRANIGTVRRVAPAVRMPG